jgi:SAM-dependent methyltransferase
VRDSSLQTQRDVSEDAIRVRVGVTSACSLCLRDAVCFLLSFDDLAVGVCRGCGTGHVLSQPRKEKEVSDEYSRIYEAEALGSKARTCWRIVSTQTRGLNLGSVLDIGCGTGAFLDCARAHGLQTAGVEVASPGVREAHRKGHEVIHGSATDNIPTNKQFDLVTAWDVLEHVECPHRLIANAVARLNVGGVFLGVTPMMNSVFDRAAVHLFRISRGRLQSLLRMCWTHEHLHRFTHDGLKVVLEEMGFGKVHVEPVLLLSLEPDRYAGGQIMAPWTPFPLLNRAISRAGVLIVKSVKVNNKILFRAEKIR